MRAQRDEDLDRVRRCIARFCWRLVEHSGADERRRALSTAHYLSEIARTLEAPERPEDAPAFFDDRLIEHVDDCWAIAEDDR